MAYALSVLHISLDDFCRLELREFTACCRAYSRHREIDMQDDWERMRLLATIVIQPHVKNKLTPDKLLPLPWDKAKTHKKSQYKPMDKEESKRRFERLVKNN